ncbi:unnamed protein product [Knipowitschia caucasica]
MNETGAQLFSRLEPRRCLKDIEPRLFPQDEGPDSGEVVEISGPEGTGKTALLYHLLIGCLLPLSAGGLEVSVAFVDTDHSLDMIRLVSLLDQRLHTAVPPADLEESLLRSCLSRLFVLHCSSSSQLLLTLHFLETTITTRPGLSLLLIDSISAFYWLDRAEGGTSYSKREERLNKCSELLGRLLRDYKITVFATCHSIRHKSSSSSATSSSSLLADHDRPYLCGAWQKLVSHRLTCSRTDTIPNMAAAEPKKDTTLSNMAASSSTGQSLSNMAATDPQKSIFTVLYSSKKKGTRTNSFIISDRGLEFV